jgi:hypothetical protein
MYIFKSRIYWFAEIISYYGWWRQPGMYCLRIIIIRYFYVCTCACIFRVRHCLVQLPPRPSHPGLYIYIYIYIRICIYMHLWPYTFMTIFIPYERFQRIIIRLDFTGNERVKRLLTMLWELKYRTWNLNTVHHN